MQLVDRTAVIHNFVRQGFVIAAAAFERSFGADTVIEEYFLVGRSSQRYIYIAVSFAVNVLQLSVRLLKRHFIVEVVYVRTAVALRRKISPPRIHVEVEWRLRAGIVQPGRHGGVLHFPAQLIEFLAVFVVKLGAVAGIVSPWLRALWHRTRQGIESAGRGGAKL